MGAKFKYRTRRWHATDEDLVEYLEDLGAKGWELVSVAPSPGADSRPVWVFKREFTDEEYGGWEWTH